MRSRLLPLVIGAGVLGMVLGALVFGAESLFWLKQGYWPGWSFADVCGCRASSEYVGLNKMLNWYLDAQLSVTMFCTSAGVFGAACYGLEGT